jgi:hypothetical protein
VIDRRVNLEASNMYKNFLILILVLDTCFSCGSEKKNKNPKEPNNEIAIPEILLTSSPDDFTGSYEMYKVYKAESCGKTLTPNKLDPKLFREYSVESSFSNPKDTHLFEKQCLDKACKDVLGTISVGQKFEGGNWIETDVGKTCGGFTNSLSLGYTQNTYSKTNEGMLIEQFYFEMKTNNCNGYVDYIKSHLGEIPCKYKLVKLLRAI